MEAVHSMTSMAMSASQRPALNSHTPPWTCAGKGHRGGGGGAQQTQDPLAGIPQPRSPHSHLG